VAFRLRTQSELLPIPTPLKDIWSLTRKALQEIYPWMKTSFKPYERRFKKDKVVDRRPTRLVADPASSMIGTWTEQPSGRSPESLPLEEGRRQLGEHDWTQTDGEGYVPYIPLVLLCLLTLGLYRSHLKAQKYWAFVLIKTKISQTEWLLLGPPGA
jgi:hypothetical protein